MSDQQKTPEEMKAEEKSLHEKRAQTFLAAYEKLCTEHGLRLVPQLGNVEFRFAVGPFEPKAPTNDNGLVDPAAAPKA